MGYLGLTPLGQVSVTVVSNLNFVTGTEQLFISTLLTAEQTADPD